MSREEEVKYKVGDIALIEQRTINLGCILDEEVEQVDRYFDYPSFVLSRHLHGLRFRSVNCDPKSFDLKVLFYFPTKPDDPWYVDEVPSSFPVQGEHLNGVLQRLGVTQTINDEELNPHELEKALLSCELVEVYRITKSRKKYACAEGMQILIDHVTELGTFVEIEGPHYDVYLNALGLPEQGEQIRWGYSSLLLREKGVLNPSQFRPQFERSAMWNVLPAEINLYLTIQGEDVDPNQKRSPLHLQNA